MTLAWYPGLRFVFDLDAMSRPRTTEDQEVGAAYLTVQHCTPLKHSSSRSCYDNHGTPIIIEEHIPRTAAPPGHTPCTLCEGFHTLSLFEFHGCNRLVLATAAATMQKYRRQQARSEPVSAGSVSACPAPAAASPCQACLHYVLRRSPN